MKKTIIFTIACLLLFSCSRKEKEGGTTNEVLTSINKTYKPSYGYLVGNIYELEAVGFSHNLPGLEVPQLIVDMPIMEHIEKVFLLQKNPKIPILDASAPSPEYYEKIIQNVATSFFTPAMQQKYPMLCVLDMRPRNMEYLMQLEYGLQVWPALEKMCANAGCFRFDRSERDGLPVYTIVENCETNFYRIVVLRKGYLAGCLSCAR